MSNSSHQTVTNGPVPSAAKTEITERYEALLRVSQTPISTRSSGELFRVLARELRAVVDFYVMGIGIYDENAHAVSLTSYGEPGDPLEVPKLAPEETFTWWVYQHQEPLIIPSLDRETRFPAVAEMLKNRGVRSVCVLPLTTVHRRLGGLAVGSIGTDAYSAEEVRFLTLVANQVALAVDDALNLEASQQTKEALRASGEGFRLIVDSIPGLINTTTAEGKFEFDGIFDLLLFIALSYTLFRYSTEQHRRQTLVEQELKAVRELQHVLIPEALPEVPGYAIASVYHPAQEVGGDFFQIIPMHDGGTLVVLGDVSGKGLKAAMNVAVIVGTVRTLAEFQSDPASILAGLNRRLVGRMQGGFTTALAFRIDRFGHCTVANAGHLPPFLNSSEMTLEPSLPLGIDPEAEYKDQDFALDCGDRLMLHTDGVLEARSGKGELYGFGRLTALLASLPDAESISDAARAFGQEDDITVVTIERLRLNEAAPSMTVNLLVGLAPA